MINFKVIGEREVFSKKNANGRIITTKNKKDFLKKNSDILDQCGCYIFAMRAGKGYTPIYVGKTEKSFRGECFQSHKLKHYYHGMSEYSRGTPVLFFIAPENNKKGAVPRRQISNLEDFLIKLGFTKNPDLKNDRGGKPPRWSISGAIRAGKGKVGKITQNFKTLMGI